MEKRLLITGASGLLGRAILQEFENQGSWTVLGLAFSRAGSKLRKVDLTDQQAVTDVMQEFKPSVVIHSAAERRPDVVENQAEAAYAVNVSATKYLCHAADAVGASVIYISTDYVFDGKSPPYQETDVPKPLNAYGKSKLEAEAVALAESSANTVLRIPILYGQVETLEESAVTVLFAKVKNTASTCVMSDYERRYPTHCKDVAAVLQRMAEKKVEGYDLSGVYHWSGYDNMTKYDMAIAMAKAFNLPTDHIQGDKHPSGGATRPYDAHLATCKLEALGMNQPSKFSVEIKPVLEKFFP